jgi:hypothetical protein
MKTRFVSLLTYLDLRRLGEACAKAAKYGRLLFFVFGFSCLAQEKDRGVINDPDGYVNVRRSKSTSSPIVARVKDNEPFTFELDEDMDWCKVTLRSGKTGWMHRSRIRLYFTEADLPEQPGPEGASEIAALTKTVAGVDYHTLARQAAQGDPEAQKKFFGLAEHVDGAAGESYAMDLNVMVHLLGDEKLATFLAAQPVSFLVLTRRAILEAFEMALTPPRYLKLHFPKTHALFLRRQLVDWPSPDGRFAIRKAFSDAEDISISKVTRAELIEKSTGKVLLNLTPDDIGIGSSREGHVLWAPDSKRFAYLSMNLQMGDGNLFSNPPRPPTKKQTTVYQDTGDGFAKVDLPLSEPPGKKDDPELKGAVVGHEYIEPVRWQEQNVLILERHDYYESTHPDGSIKGVGRLWEITVSFGADGKPDVKWKRAEPK